MYNAETAGEQMGSVCLAEVVPGVALEGVVVAEEQSAAGSPFMDDVDVLRRELGLAGLAFEVVASACRMTGVPAEGGLVAQAAACRAALVGGPRAAGKALHAPAAAQTQVAPAAAQMDRGFPIAGATGAAAPYARVAPRPSAHVGRRLLLSVSAAGLRLLLFRRQARARASRDASRLQSVPRPAPPPRGLQPAHTHHVGKIRARQ